MRWLFLFLALVSGSVVRADDTALLQQVAKNWLDERDHWAFTQMVREFDGKELSQERLERYDPSRGFADRWQLISINGQPPSAKELSEWRSRKNKKQRR